MAENTGPDTGGQREFDPEREREAVKKMKDWEIGLEEDPAMKEVGGEPWWKGL